MISQSGNGFLSFQFVAIAYAIRHEVSVNDDNLKTALY